MEGVKVYILVEDKEKGSEVRIDGNLESLRELLSALRKDSNPLDTNHTIQQKQKCDSAKVQNDNPG
jgi:hypothetical protein